MSFLIHLSDTHILPPGELLYNSIDSAGHLRETVHKINRMRPQPDAVVITGDLVDQGDLVGYRYFSELIKPLKMPVYVTPGNHDDPETMKRVFAGTSCFPVNDKTYQYAVDDFPFRILALNSCCVGTELPEFDDQRLSWLKSQLELSDKPVMIALHHPPMTTGIELIDMGGSQWHQGIKVLLEQHDQVRLIICGHCHTDLSGRIGNVPVYMASSTSHQLVASRGITIAPSAHIVAATPVLHHFIEGNFLSGSNAWPSNVEEDRIDRISGLSWDQLKKNMMGTRS
jgi:Icc protein